MIEQHIRLAFNRSSGTFSRLPTPVVINVFQASKNVEYSKDCLICLEDIKSESRLVLRDCACHSRNYCFQCLIKWLQKNTICPICKETITNVWHPTEFDIKAEFRSKMYLKLKEFIEIPDQVTLEELFKFCNRFEIDISYKLENNAKNTERCGVQKAMDFISHDNLRLKIESAVQYIQPSDCIEIMKQTLEFR